MTVRFPTTGAIAGDLYGMVLRELTLCKTTSEETVVIFTDTRTNTNYAAAFLAAAKEVAATAFEIKIPLLPRTAGGDTDVAPVVEILKTAQLVVDLTTAGVLYLYGKGLADVLSGGTRVLQVRGTEDQLKRCFPDEAVRQRTLNGGQRLEQAGEIRVTTDTGTDLSMRKDGRRGVTQYGISDVPGRWDSWPSGFPLLRAAGGQRQRHADAGPRGSAGDAGPLRAATRAHRREGRAHHRRARAAWTPSCSRSTWTSREIPRPSSSRTSAGARTRGRAGWK